VLPRDTLQVTIDGYGKFDSLILNGKTSILQNAINHKKDDFITHTAYTPHIHTHTCMYVYIYIYTHTHTHTHT